MSILNKEGEKNIFCTTFSHEQFVTYIFLCTKWNIRKIFPDLTVSGAIFFGLVEHGKNLVAYCAMIIKLL